MRRLRQKLLAKVLAKAEKECSSKKYKTCETLPRPLVRSFPIGVEPHCSDRSLVPSPKQVNVYVARVIAWPLSPSRREKGAIGLSLTDDDAKSKSILVSAAEDMLSGARNLNPAGWRQYVKTQSNRLVEWSCAKAQLARAPEWRQKIWVSIGKLELGEPFGSIGPEPTKPPSPDQATPTATPGQENGSATATPTPTSTDTPANGGQLSITAGGPYPSDPGLAIQFTATVSGGVPPYSFAWKFGDGAMSSDAAPQHAYAQVGTFPVDVSVTDARGAGKTASTTARIANGPQLSTGSNQTVYDGMEAYWKFDEATGTLAIDSSGNDHTGSYSGNGNVGVPGPSTDTPSVAFSNPRSRELYGNYSTIGISGADKFSLTQSSPDISISV